MTDFLDEISEAAKAAPTAAADYGAFGCSRETMDRIAEVLGVTNQHLARSGLDLDVLQTARWLVQRETGCPEGFLDAVLIAAKNLTITYVPDDVARSEAFSAAAMVWEKMTDPRLIGQYSPALST
jgi:hypothetical protein